MSLTAVREVLSSVNPSPGGDGQGAARAIGLDPVALRLARSVATVFQQLFGVRWSRALEKAGQSPSDWLRTWTASFQAAGLRDVDVKRALDRIYAERFEWPPLPLEFLALADVVIDFESAFREAQRNMAARRAGFDPQWSYDFLFWVVQREFNPVRFVELPYSPQVAKQWTNAVRGWQFRDCGPVPKVNAEKLLPRPGGAHSDDVRQAALAKMRSALKGVDKDTVLATATLSVERLHEKLGKMSDK